MTGTNELQYVDGNVRVAGKSGRSKRRSRIARVDNQASARTATIVSHNDLFHNSRPSNDACSCCMDYENEIFHENDGGAFA